MIRVFPRRTKWTPTDELAFVGLPTFFAPSHKKVFISVTFTWDLPEAYQIFKQWKHYYSDVRIGGPALQDPGGEFIPGQFIKQGVTITSRGCPQECSWCLVPEREGQIRELRICDGWDVAVNNLLACSRNHIEKVFNMLERQPEPIRFSGGLDSRLLERWHIDKIKSLRLRFMWFACDFPGAEIELERVADLTSDFSIEKKRCYVLIGHNGEDLLGAERRLEAVYNLGFLPFAMLYRSDTMEKRKDQWSRPWIELQAKWCQPRLYKNREKRESSA